jgi:acetate---CoA ligase (ADP-forming)
MPEPALDVTGRPTTLRELDLDPFFHPKTIAVIGASDTPGSASALNYRLVRDWQKERTDGAAVYPVNPNRDEVDGERCYRSVLDIPEDVDVAIVLVAAAEETLQACVDKKVGFVLIFTAGFAEVGAEGVARQRKLEAIVADSDTRLVGPNTALNAFQPFREDLLGKRIALVTQSGHQGRPIYQAQDLGVALWGWALTGNEGDVETADVIAYFAEQPDVGAIAGYIEGFKDGRTFMLAADRAAQRRVPIVLIKPGRSDIGRSWVQSHTGHLAGSDAVLTALLRQFGVTRVDGLDELLEVSAMFARCGKPRGDGIAIYSISGGTNTHVADWAASVGLRLPEFTAPTQSKLHDWIPEYLRVSNPVDSGGHPTGDERGPKILDAILDDPNIDVLIVPVAGSFSPISDRFAQDLVDAAERHPDKPVCVIWGSPPADEPGYRDVLTKQSRVPVFRSTRNCLTAVKAWLDYHAFADGYRSPFAKPVTRATPAARRAQSFVRPSSALSEHEAKLVLAEYGIPVTREVLCTSAAEAVRAAKQIGYPVVMKACSPNLLHKSDRGLVEVGGSSATAVRDSYERLTELVGAEIDGVLVSELAVGGVETVLGVSQDRLFGPVVMFGLGGIAVEVWRDVTFRVPPFDRSEARRMIEEIRSSSLLKGARGKPKADLRALADAIMKVQRLGLDLSGELAELDVNPLLAGPHGVVALDALLVWK